MRYGSVDAAEKHHLRPACGYEFATAVYLKAEERVHLLNAA
jgi:hypothetical protein